MSCTSSSGRNPSLGGLVSQYVFLNPSVAALAGCVGSSGDGSLEVVPGPAVTGRYSGCTTDNTLSLADVYLSLTQFRNGEYTPYSRPSDTSATLMIRRAGTTSLPRPWRFLRFLTPLPDSHGRSPAIATFGLRVKHRLNHEILTTTAAASEVPQRLQNLRPGGLTSPQVPQTRSPCRGVRVGLLGDTFGG